MPGPYPPRLAVCYDRARLFVGGAAYDNHEYRNNFSIVKIDPKRRTATRRAWELDPRGPRWEEKDQQEYSLRIEKPGRNQVNPVKYIAWLQDETRSIELSQLHVAPQDVPPPGIDTLFIRLTTAGPAKGVSGPGRPEPIPLQEALRNNRKLVIEGKPGCGKTTFVRWIAWMLCRPGGAPADLLAGQLLLPGRESSGYPDALPCQVKSPEITRMSDPIGAADWAFKTRSSILPQKPVHNYFSPTISLHLQ